MIRDGDHLSFEQPPADVQVENLTDQEPFEDQVAAFRAAVKEWQDTTAVRTPERDAELREIITNGPVARWAKERRNA